jgi:hypothetical protein
LGRRRLSLQIQPLIHNSKESASAETVLGGRSGYLPTIPCSESTLDRKCRNDVKYKSESFGLNESNRCYGSGEGSARGSLASRAQILASFDCCSNKEEMFIWVWNNLSTRDKMRRKSLAAACITPTEQRYNQTRL